MHQVQEQLFHYAVVSLLTRPTHHFALGPATYANTIRHSSVNTQSNYWKTPQKFDTPTLHPRHPGSKHNPAYCAHSDYLRTGAATLAVYAEVLDCLHDCLTVMPNSPASGLVLVQRYSNTLQLTQMCNMPAGPDEVPWRQLSELEVQAA